ncbi:MAG TPA: histidinol dehydrogenase [Bacteroidales bacterium]|nr:histidinol dehydrogenase [Bacteroidales bacterium]HRT89636.1 histidinol dehydrogenase [Bacteroidales bacterium]
MKVHYRPERGLWESLCARPRINTEGLNDIIFSIIENVCLKGDEALLQYCEKYDGVRPSSLTVTPAEFEEAAASVPDSLKKAIATARKNIEKFHFSIMSPDPSMVVISTGISCRAKYVPIERAGLYVPGGSAPLFSTVLMLGIPARLAGCSDIILCTPPQKDGKVNDVILYTARLLGIDRVYKVGGAQAIAAMAFGTQTIPKVNKIFGPGNRFVTKAKELVQQYGTAIDMPAGPSEVLVIADKSANPSFVAADLLSQAEHGPDSQVILLSDSPELIEKAIGETNDQLTTLPRKETAEISLRNSHAILLNSLEECVEFSNLYAPEHLIINCKNYNSIADKIKSAGSVFLGPYSCESTGDYAAGPNHTLPTGGFAQSISGLTADSFRKQIFFQEVTEEGLALIGPAVTEMAEAEELKAHSNAVKIRFRKE